jgi:protein involved in polysaccharide export with SLBB domain
LPVDNVINVSGNVYNPGLISFSPGMTMYDAIEMAGGYKPYSLKKRAFVIRANGEREKVNIFRGRTKRVFAGDSIFIPVNPNPSDFDITTFIADLSSTLENIAAILIIADNNN